MLSSLFFVLSLSFSLFIVLSISCRIWNNIITQTISSIHTFVYIVIIFQMERFAFALLFHNLLSTFFSLYFRYYDQIFITKWTKFRFKLHCVWNVNINNGHHRSKKREWIQAEFRTSCFIYECEQIIFDCAIKKRWHWII